MGQTRIAAAPTGRPALRERLPLPARGTGAALALPYADTEAMQFHLDEISHTVAKGAHAVLLLDRAGWHTTGNLVVPRNITLVFLPSRAPELNPVENVWQYLRHKMALKPRPSSTRPARPGASSWPSQTPSPQFGLRDWARVDQR